MGLRSRGHYGSCEGLTGTLNKLANRGPGKSAGGQSLPQTNLRLQKPTQDRPYASHGAMRKDDDDEVKDSRADKSRKRSRGLKKQAAKYMYDSFKPE